MKTMTMLMSRFTQYLVALVLIAVSVSAHAVQESITYIHTDHLGSPVMATAQDGAVKWREDYQPYGAQLIKEDTDNTVGFTGHKDEKVLGVTYMQGRWYHPEMGRFAAIDPVGFVEGNPASFNRYAYGNNNPYKFVDPDGKTPIYATMGPPAPFDSGAEGMEKAVQAQKAVLEGTVIGGTIGASLIFPPLAAFLEFDALMKGEPVPPIVSGKISQVVVKSGAESAANASRLRAQLAGQEIAGGHAFEKHVIQLGEFAGFIKTRQQFAEHIESVINNPTATKQLGNGRSAYWDDATRTVVIRNPKAADGGTAFQPTNGRAYFDSLR